MLRTRPVLLEPHQGCRRREKMVGRRQFLMAGTVSGAAMLLPQGLQGVPAFASHGTGAGHPDLEVTKTPPLEKYVDPLPRLMTAIPDRSVHRGADYYELTMLQRPWQFHRDLGAGAVWGYWAKNPYDPDMPIGMGYFGPTIVATKDHPTVVKYRTELPTTHLFQGRVDQLHHDSPDMLPENLSVWNVVHHHGGFTPPQSDGLPLQWFTSEGVHGPDYATLDPRRAAPNEAIYGYTNHEHTSCMLWYHDHAIGITSLNVYAGLAGAYLIHDPADRRLGLPQDEFEVPLILADRTFQPDGSLAYTLDKEFGADTPVVNGRAYPFLEVQPRRYRLRILNASNTRTWRLRFNTGTKTLPFWLIGTDDGYRSPLQLESILIGSAERIDLIVDFSRVPMGTNVTLENFDAPVYFPNGNGAEIPEVMQFRVTERLSGADRTTPPRTLALPPVMRIRHTSETSRRQFVVYQRTADDPLQFNALPFMAPSADFIEVGSTEIWEYINPQPVAHPVHVHLVNFQVLERQPFDGPAFQKVYKQWVDNGSNPADKPEVADYLTGPPTPPDPDEEMARKDTVRAYQGMVTRIIHQFDVPGTIASIPHSGTELPATYIHHCHILEHECDDLMRPWTIIGHDGHHGHDSGGGSH
ncbi:multicopper oxidase family protein [Streptomyces sp. NBC_01579]|uniref:multicopper oxidase family protein n=1 Tax=Streptomyces sp. NBC_01579 TaxID=2975885 RepID=UPI0038708198